MKRSILICLVCSSLVDIATTQRPPRSRSGGSTKGAGAAQPDVVVTAATMRDAYNVDNIDYDQPRRNFLRKGSSSGSAAAAGKQAVSLEPASVARIGSDGINLPLDADDVATPTDSYVAASTGNGRYKTRGGNKIDERRGGVGDEEDSIPKTILVRRCKRKPVGQETLPLCLLMFWFVLSLYTWIYWTVVLAEASVVLLLFLSF